MEATKKISTTRAALLVVAALSMLLSGLFVATASRSDASPPPACPDGFTLQADGKACFKAADVVSTDGANTCAEGQITPDGTKCWEPARILPQEGTTYCPDGYSPDNSLGGMCARFEAATQLDAECPAGSFGTAGGCYIFVAKGPAGDLTCAAGSTLSGSTCVLVGPAPTPGAGSCPVSATVFLTGGQCYSVVTPTTVNDDCVAPFALSAAGGVCKVANPNAVGTQAKLDWTCPAGPTGVTVSANTETFNGVTKIASCTYAVQTSPSDCPTGSQLVGSQCRVPVALTAGGLQCTAGYGLVGSQCLAYDNPTAALASCPIGSLEDPQGQCRKPVLDQAGAYTCPANAALNNKSCVYTTGFLIDPSPTLYKCDRGVRAVIGSGSSAFGDGSTVQVVCFLADPDPNLATAATCPIGALDTTGQYCIVARIDTAPAAAVAAPTPAFTG